MGPRQEWGTEGERESGGNWTFGSERTVEYTDIEL